MGHQSYWQNVGDKIHTGVKTLAAMKGIWDTGKAIYNGVRVAAPYIEGLVSTAALL